MKERGGGKFRGSCAIWSHRVTVGAFGIDDRHSSLRCVGYSADGCRSPNTDEHHTFSVTFPPSLTPFVLTTLSVHPTLSDSYYRQLYPVSKHERNFGGKRRDLALQFAPNQSPLAQSHLYAPFLLLALDFFQ